VFVLGFRLTQQGHVVALLVRQVSLEQVLAVLLRLPLVYTSFPLRILRRKKIVVPPHAPVFSRFEVSI
jgi:hypothetical protein